MILIKTLTNGLMQIAIYKCENGVYKSYIIRTRQEGGNQFINSTSRLNLLEETLLKRYHSLYEQ